MIRVGIGGWTFEPWRGLFYPPDLPQARELEYASRAVTAIEVNGTFYSTFKPDTFRKWAAASPESFVFALKAPRYATNRRRLAEAKSSIDRFVDSGIAELGGKLGPILWQFAPTKAYDPEDFAAFLDLLPASLRHAIEVRHESFLVPDLVAELRRRNMALVAADTPKYPNVADVTADFVYARLQDARDEVETGYDDDALDAWAARAKTWEKGGRAGGLELVDDKAAVPKVRRDVFVFMINGAKRRAPAAAKALIARLG